MSAIKTILAGSVCLLSFLAATSSASAATDNYTLNVTYNSSNCTPYINGQTGIINQNITQGDDANITINNNSAVTLGVYFAEAGGVVPVSPIAMYPSGKTFTPSPDATGPTYSHTFSGLQGNLSINISDNDGCNVGNGNVPATFSLNPSVPQKVTPPPPTHNPPTQKSSAQSSTSTPTSSTNTTTQAKPASPGSSTTANNSETNKQAPVATQTSPSSPKQVKSSNTAVIVKTSAAILIVLVIAGILAATGIWSAPTRLARRFRHHK